MTVSAFALRTAEENVRHVWSQLFALTKALPRLPDCTELHVYRLRLAEDSIYNALGELTSLADAAEEAEEMATEAADLALVDCPY